MSATRTVEVVLTRVSRIGNEKATFLLTCHHDAAFTSGHRFDIISSNGTTIHTDVVRIVNRSNGPSLIGLVVDPNLYAFRSVLNQLAAMPEVKNLRRVTSPS